MQCSADVPQDTLNMRAGVPLCLLFAVLQGNDAQAQRVRQLLLESPTFEQGLVSMQDTWLDVLHSSEGATLLPLVSVGSEHMHHTCLEPGSMLATLLPGLIGTCVRHPPGTWLAPVPPGWYLCHTRLKP
jgi:hypothetical protein